MTGAAGKRRACFGKPAVCRRTRGGFAVAMVVLLLFAISLAAATGYQLVRLEAELALQARNSTESLAAARAGLERYAAEHLGVPDDSTSYVVGDASVVVRTRLLAALDSVTDLYLLEAEGSASDPRLPGGETRSLVRQYARLHKDPVNVIAAVLLPSASTRVRFLGTVDGRDQASPADCLVGGAQDVAGVANIGGATEEFGGDLDGAPPSLVLADFDEVVDTARVRWDVISDPTFPVAIDGGIPDFGSIPVDSFPVVRVTDNLTAGWGDSGRGVLIVPGRFRIGNGFSWDGIILAGDVGDLSGFASEVRGAIIGGLDGPERSEDILFTDIRYDACNVWFSNRSLAYLELLAPTWWEDL